MTWPIYELLILTSWDIQVLNHHLGWRSGGKGRYYLPMKSWIFMVDQTLGYHSINFTGWFTRILFTHTIRVLIIFIYLHEWLICMVNAGNGLWNNHYIHWVVFNHQATRIYWLPSPKLKAGTKGERFTWKCHGGTSITPPIFGGFQPLVFGGLVHDVQCSFHGLWKSQTLISIYIYILYILYIH